MYALKPSKKCIFSYAAIFFYTKPPKMYRNRWCLEHQVINEGAQFDDFFKRSGANGQLISVFNRQRPGDINLYRSISSGCPFLSKLENDKIRTHVWGGREGRVRKVRLRIHREGGSKIPIFLRTYLMNGPLGRKLAYHSQDKV